MSSSYLQAKLAEALLQCGGRKQQAQKLLVERAQTDPRLLQALARPFLAGLVAHAMGQADDSTTARRSGGGAASQQRTRASAGRTGAGKNPAAAPPSDRRMDAAAAMNSGAFDAMVAQMGENFAATQPAGATPVAKQADTLRAISKAQWKTRLERDHDWPKD